MCCGGAASWGWAPAQREPPPSLAIYPVPAAGEWHRPCSTFTVMAGPVRRPKAGTNPATTIAEISARLALTGRPALLPRKADLEGEPMRVKDVKKVVLAYSGGLDTSVILRW